MMRIDFRAVVLGALLVFGGLSIAVAEDTVESRVTAFVESATTSAQALNDRYEGLVESLENASSIEEATARLDELVEAARAAVSAYGDDAEIWSRYDDLESFVEARRKNADEKQKTDPRWSRQAAGWRDQSNAIKEVRLQFLKERQRAEGLLERVEADRELMVDQMALEGAAAAVGEMRGALEDLISVNSNIEAALGELQRRYNSADPN